MANSITLDENSSNYLNCDLTATVLNPNGAIKYLNHFHTALHEDETYDYFIPYQVKVINKYAGIHRGPARKYQSLAMIIDKDVYTIIEERNGWGRLKEYPIGWVLLNQTEPITGPGQNPEYDIADAETATIPFATKINITKLTVDRLWGYCPDLDSWIKTEDISFDQSGKLFSGLKINTIDLTKVDWDNADDYSDIGIDLQKYLLKFHQPAEVENITINHDSISALHELDVVYNETIYDYTCHYYQYHKSDSNELGTAAFSCSISDWNPDWDTFISTSWQVEEIIDYGEATATSGQKLYDENQKIVYSCASGESIKISGEKNSNGWYPVEVSNYIGYMILTDSQITKTYGGTFTQDINPTLYRDTEIILDWSYFGFERNLFKPEGFGDGIYLWNPRCWDKDNIKFTFNELITCGSQYVIYPVFNPNTYKLWCQRNYLGVSYDSGNTSIRAINPGISMNLAGSYGKYEAAEDSEYKIYDIYTSGEITTPMQNVSGTYITKTWLDSSAYFDPNTYNKVIAKAYPYFALSDFVKSDIDIGNPEVGDTFIWNLSNKRNSPNVVLGFGNAIKNKENRYYIYKDNEWTQIFDNTNLDNAHKKASLALDFYDTTHAYPLGIDPNPTDLRNNRADHYSHSYGVLYDTIAYENSMMIHYWIPVPKGLWYNYNGKDLRMTDNGMFDLLTGELARSYRTTDGVVTIYSNYKVTPTVDGNDLIFLRDEELDESKAYNFFENWDYATEDCNYWVSLKANTDSFKSPDLYSNKIRTMKKGLYIPVSQYAAPSKEHRVTGEWYFGGDQWFSTSNATISTLSSSYNIKNEKQTICLVPKSDTSIFYASLNPQTINAWSENDSVGNAQESYGHNAQVITTYATITFRENTTPMAYFDGNAWIPFSYTHNNVSEKNENYVIAQDTKCYKYPIEDNTYYTNTYLYGDRVTVTKACKNDSTWMYTGAGWIKQTANNLSLVE